MKKIIVLFTIIVTQCLNGAEPDNSSNRLSDEIKRAHRDRPDILFMLLPPSRDSKAYKPNASIGDKQFTPFGLEIKNKTGKPIWVTVANEAINTRKTSYVEEVSSNDPLKPNAYIGIPEKPLKIYKIPHGQSGAFAIDTAYNSAIAIWKEHPADEVLLRRNYDLANRQQIWLFQPDPALIIQTKESAQGKTVYITIDKLASGGARPQTGPSMGLSGRTDTGLKLDSKKNVSKEDLLYIVKYSNNDEE